MDGQKRNYIFRFDYRYIGPTHNCCPGPSSLASLLFDINDVTGSVFIVIFFSRLFWKYRRFTCSAAFCDRLSLQFSQAAEMPTTLPFCTFSEKNTEK